jgi:hypothetical protein
VPIRTYRGEEEWIEVASDARREDGVGHFVSQFNLRLGRSYADRGRGRGRACSLAQR